LEFAYRDFFLCFLEASGLTVLRDHPFSLCATFGSSEKKVA